MQVALDANGAWVDLKEIADLRRGDRKAVNAAIVTEYNPETGNPIMRGSVEDDMTEAIAAHVVLNWSLPFPLPAVDPESLDKLTLEQADNLDSALKPYRDALQAKTAPSKDNEVPTPASAS